LSCVYFAANKLVYLLTKHGSLKFDKIFSRVRTAQE